MTAPAPTDAGALREALAVHVRAALYQAPDPQWSFQERYVGREAAVARAVDDLIAGPLAALLAENQQLRNRCASHRWNIDEDGSDLLVCKGHHDKGEDCEPDRYVLADERVARATTDADLAKAREEIAGLEAALKRIVDMEPATTEITLAHEMAQEARAALTHGGDRGEN